MSKQFLYRFADGAEIETADMTNAFLAELIEQHGKCVYNGFRDQLESLQLLRANSHKKKTDGFQPGFHPGLNMEIRTHGQYQEVLKERGLIEVGNEKSVDKKTSSSSVFTEDIIREAVQSGADISGQQADALIKGESIT